jgi:hypothetical protein
MARRQRPNLVELEGAGREASFSGDEIRSSRNALFGTLVSVELANRPDQDTLFLVLVVPTVNLDDSRTARVRTFAVLTTHRTSLRGPDTVDGQLQTYETVNLRGTASQVDF